MSGAKGRGVCHDVLALRRAGATIAEIALLTGLSESGVKYLIKRDIRPAKPAKPTQTRRCLCCGKPFASEGPHNRLCGGCSKRDVSPFEPDI